MLIPSIEKNKFITDFSLVFSIFSSFISFFLFLPLAIAAGAAEIASIFSDNLSLIFSLNCSYFNLLFDSR